MRPSIVHFSLAVCVSADVAVADTAKDSEEPEIDPDAEAIVGTIITASDELDVFVNSGLGFQSNDARWEVATGGDDALARAIGAETGARLSVGNELRASVAAWYLRVDSQQEWSGDLGGTAPSDPTRSYGLDLDWQWTPRPWLGFDAHVVLAPRVIGGGGVTVRSGTSFAALRFRGNGFGLVDVVTQHAMGKATIGVSIENLFDADRREAPLAALVTLSRAL